MKKKKTKKKPISLRLNESTAGYRTRPSCSFQESQDFLYKDGDIVNINGNPNLPTDKWKVVYCEGYHGTKA